MLRNEQPPPFYLMHLLATNGTFNNPTFVKTLLGGRRRLHRTRP